MIFNNASCDSTEISSETVHKLIWKLKNIINIWVGHQGYRYINTVATWLIFSTVIVVIGWQWHFFVRSIFVFGLWRAGRARWRGGAGNITVSFGFINRFCRLIIHGYWAVQWFWLLIGFTQQRIWLFILCWLLTVFIFWRLHLLVSFRSWPWVLDFSFPLQLWFQDTLQLWLR